MIIDLHELRRRDFGFYEIKIIKQSPTYTFLDCKSRKVDGILYVLDGKGRYSFDGGEFTLERGSVVYLPLGSRHKLCILSPKIEFYRLDFKVMCDGKYARFSDGPLKLCDKAPYECLEALKELEEVFLRDDDNILKTEKLCKFFSGLDGAHTAASRAKLSPAIERLHECADGEKINCAELAELCFLSVSQFYKLFRDELGTSPLEYRANIIIRKAAAMLESGEMTVGEVAAALGFDTPSYFCRFFKKRTGTSPLGYIKRCTV